MKKLPVICQNTGSKFEKKLSVNLFYIDRHNCKKPKCVVSCIELTITANESKHTINMDWEYLDGKFIEV